MDHRKPHEPPFSDGRPTPLLYWGIDFSETISGLAQLHRLARKVEGQAIEHSTC